MMKTRIIVVTISLCVYLIFYEYWYTPLLIFLALLFFWFLNSFLFFRAIRNGQKVAVVKRRFPEIISYFDLISGILFLMLSFLQMDSVLFNKEHFGLLFYIGLVNILFSIDLTNYYKLIFSKKSVTFEDTVMSITRRWNYDNLKQVRVLRDEIELERNHEIHIYKINDRDKLTIQKQTGFLEKYIGGRLMMADPK